MKRPNIILTGFMGTGKSSSGRVLARKLGYEFIDSDTMIEMQQGLSVAEIFAQQGEAAFRRFESEAAAELAKREGLVIATGGKLMLDSKNAENLGKTGKVFCLTATHDELLNRLSGKSARQRRPLLHGVDLDQYLKKVMQERGPAYQKFQQVDTTGKKPFEVAKQILHLLKAKKRR
jgi:shikimate kinase